MFLFLTFVIALASNLVLTPIILRLAHRKKWYDSIDHRKVHKGEVPRLGGTGIFISFIFSYFITVLVIYPVNGIESPINIENMVLLGGFTLVHIVGLIDDFRNMRAIYKLLGQILAGFLLVQGGVTFLTINLPFGTSVIHLGVFGGIATVFLLISLSNALNLIDGVDGLAGGVSLIASLAIAVVHIVTDGWHGAVLSISLAGAILGFLFFNKPKAKVFMGDSGAIFLGFALASVLFVNENQTVNGNGLIVIIVILIVPIGDMLASMVRRIRRSQPIYKPDREHIHHKLLDFGVRVPGILSRLLLLTTVAATSSVIFLISRLNPNGIPPWIGSTLVVISVIVVAVFFFSIHKKYKSIRKHFPSTQTKD